MATLAASRQMSTLEVALRTFRARLFEAAPGLVTWVLLLAPAWIPIAFPFPGAFAVAGAVLVFDVYWLFRSGSVLRGVYETYSRMRRDMSADWLALCEQERAAGGRDPLKFIHLSIIPTYTEPYHVLERTVQAIVDANYPPELKMIAIITRDTDKAGWENVAKLKARFGDRLRGFYHIKDAVEPGVVVGKSAAMNWGGRWMVRVLTDEGYELNRILITDLDSDYRVHPQYFAWISWHHSREPLRDYTIWQPVPLFHNNVWQALRGEVGVPAAVWGLAEVARLRVDASVPVQPDQAVGVGGDGRALRAGAAVQASGDPIRAEAAALLESVRESPQLELPAGAADVRK